VFLLTGALLPAPLPLAGCRLYLDVSGPALAITGTAMRTLPLPLPPEPALLCLQLCAQGFVVEVASGVLAGSNALTSVFGS
jgi:hypothetical protein